MIDVDDRNAAGAHQAFEQNEFGPQVGVECLMIVEMVARDVGEGADLDAQAVEPMLIEPMR